MVKDCWPGADGIGWRWEIAWVGVESRRRSEVRLCGRVDVEVFWGRAGAGCEDVLLSTAEVGGVISAVVAIGGGVLVEAGHDM